MEAGRMSSGLSILKTSAAILALVSRTFALDGQVQIHDPSTIVPCDGKFYTYGTGGTCLISDDGWTWYRGTPPARRGMAPDIIHLGERYYMYVARNVGAQPRADINMIWSKTLDTNSPDYKWEEGGVVASSDGIEDCNAIDPGAFLDPNDGRLWLVYGSYFGYIRLVELDPRTGKRVNPNDQPVNVAINCEASDLIYHDGWYYLLATHGSCCRGADSGYNIRVGRSKGLFGPYLDNMDVQMLQGGGKLFLGSGGRVIGPGHFGLLDLGGGVQKFSCHFDAYLARVGGRRGRRVGRGVDQSSAIPAQDVAQVSTNWPADSVPIRLANYLCQAQQKWSVTAATNAGGYLGSPYFKICIAGTERVLAATDDGELVALPNLSGGPEQLWRIDQLTDGTWRILSKTGSKTAEPLTLSAIGSSSATLARFNPDTDKQHWVFKTP